MGGLRVDSGPILTHMRASLSWIVETVAPEIQQHVSCLSRPAAAPEGGETGLSSVCGDLLGRRSTATCYT